MYNKKCFVSTGEIELELLPNTNIQNIDNNEIVQSYNQIDKKISLEYSATLPNLWLCGFGKIF